MGWAETRRSARAIVHDQFKLPGRYYATPGAGIGAPVSVRVHAKAVDIGNLNREGYGQTTEEVEQLVFSREDVIALGVTRGGYLKLDDPDNRGYRLSVRLAENDPNYITYEVTRVEG
jgi:hypothetical protein